MAQISTTGTVVDETGAPIFGAAVVENGTTNGTATDIDGNFKLQLTKSPAEINITFLGYKNQTLSSSGGSLGKIQLELDSKALDDVVVTSSIAVQRKTPVALSSISPQLVSEKLGSQEFVEILKSTPGVYATKRGGAFGDSDVNMRGFKSMNIAVLVNGVPVNDMEWGGVYWSNWTGLSDVMVSTQTQRGLGAAKISAPSVGGSINIVTKSIELKPSGTVQYGMGNDGYKKLSAMVSTGLNSNGWAFTILLGKTWGNGYVQGTEFEGYNWFANISKRLSADQQLSLTAFGAPQWHNQRSSYDGLSIVGWQLVKDYMKGDSEYKYNATFGYGKNGERKTSARNVYHKPQISLNHQWQITDNQSLSSAIYCSIGRGYGFQGQTTAAYSNQWYGASNGNLNYRFRNADGTFAYDQIQEINEQSDHGSEMVMAKNKNEHTWIGFVSNYNNDINDRLNISGGVDFRWYKGVHTTEICDLYNGEYFIDRNRANVKAINNKAAADSNWKNEKLHVGDNVYRDYDGYTVQTGIYAQGEYTWDKLNAFISGSVSSTSYWRYDRFYYDSDHAKSDKINFWGGTIKGGANYNINNYNNIFFNVGFISRTPLFSGGAFLSSSNSHATNSDAVNEKINSFEIGYGFHNSWLNANINIYHTNWKDKSMVRSADYTDENGVPDRYSINLEGIDARHQGIEIDINANALSWLDVNAMLSIGDWVWDGDAQGYFYNSTGQPLADAKGKIASGVGAEDHAQMKINLDKVKVGGSAQTTAALGAKIKPIKGFHIGIDWNLYARNYADWSFSTNDIQFNGFKSYADPWRIPSANLFDANAGYSFKLGEKVSAYLNGVVNNLFDQEYISDATDGADHTWKTAYLVFYGFGRTYSVNLELSF